MPLPDRFSARWFQIFCTVLLLAALGLLITEALARTDGLLMYTLDDPYIHLTVTESLLRGSYGINIGEVAAPSSSILYPFLLLPFEAVGLGLYGPLILAVPASLIAMWFVSGRVWTGLETGFGSLRVLGFLLLAPALLLAVNAAALPLTGMEHSIHVMAAVLALAGLIRLNNDRADTTGLRMAVAGIVICALIRFEGLALAFAGIGALLFLGQRKAALLTAAAILGVLALWVIVMSLLGLPPLPSSVLTKSTVAASATDDNLLQAAKRAVRNVFDVLQGRWGFVFAIACILLMMNVLRSDAPARQRRVILLVAFAVLAAHLVAGRYGWFGRYEVYAVAVMLIGVTLIPGSFAGPSPLANAIGLPLIIAVIAMPYLGVTIQTPAAAANIYQQQYQMHRFIDEFYPEPVAVNDLGWVAYRNDNHVLDLWGLGSEEARKFRAEGGWTAGKMDDITTRQGTNFAMIYDDWFPEVPDSWCRMGRLVTSQVTAASGEVAFYLLVPEDETRMGAALDAFAQTLPRGARFERDDGCEVPS